MVPVFVSLQIDGSFVPGNHRERCVLRHIFKCQSTTVIPVKSNLKNVNVFVEIAFLFSRINLVKHYILLISMNPIKDRHQQFKCFKNRHQSIFPYSIRTNGMVENETINMLAIFRRFSLDNL